MGRARKRSAPRPHRAGDLHRRPGHRARLRRRRLRPASRATAPGSGSTSPTSPPTSNRARCSTRRRGGAATAPTSPARSSRCCRTRSRSEACSLAPGVERLAVTTEVELGPGMEPRRARFYRSRIRSDVRLNYDQLDEIFAGRAQPPAEVAEPLAAAREVAAGLGEHRGTTSLDVESFEPEFRFDAEGNVVAAHGVAQTEAHRLIERLMILNNEQVAQLLERERVPAIYRVHAQPDAARIERLLEQLAALGVPTPPLGQGLWRRSEAGQGRRRGEPAGAARGRATRARPGGVYLARAPIPQAGHLQRAERRPRRPRQLRLLPLHLADPPLPRPRLPPGAAGAAGGGGGGADAGRGPRRRRRLLGAGARVGADRAPRRRRLRRLPARTRAGRARASTPSSRARSPG